jgi:hypothetical protein
MVQNTVVMERAGFKPMGDPDDKFPGRPILREAVFPHVGGHLALDFCNTAAEAIYHVGLAIAQGDRIIRRRVCKS